MAHDLLTVDQVADGLQLEPGTVRGWLRTGKFRAAKFERVWRVREQDLEAFIAQYLPAYQMQEH